MVIARRCFVVLALLFSTSVLAAGAVELKFHPAKGSTTKLKVAMDQKVTQTINGTANTVNQAVTLVYRMDAGDLDADGATSVKVTYESISFKQQTNVGNVDFDSNNPPPTVPAAARGVAALVGQTFTAKISPTGHVTDVKGVDEMIDSILKKLGVPDGPTKPLLDQSLRKEFGADAIRENMEAMLLIYPEKPVATGDSWTHPLSITKGFPMLVVNTFTLKEAGAELATVDLKSTLMSNADAPPIDMGNRKLTYRLSGNQRGVMKLNRGDGMIQSGDVTQKVEGKIMSDTKEGTTEVPVVIETHLVMGRE